VDKQLLLHENKEL